MTRVLLIDMEEVLFSSGRDENSSPGLCRDFIGEGRGEGDGEVELKVVFSSD